MPFSSEIDYSKVFKKIDDEEMQKARQHAAKAMGYTEDKAVSGVAAKHQAGPAPQAAKTQTGQVIHPSPNPAPRASMGRSLVNLVFRTIRSVPVIKEGIELWEEIITPDVPNDKPAVLDDKSKDGKALVNAVFQAVGQQNAKPKSTAPSASNDGKALVNAVFKAVGQQNAKQKRPAADATPDEPLLEFLHLTEKMRDTSLWDTTEGVRIMQALAAGGPVIIKANNKHPGLPAYCFINGLRLEKPDSLMKPYANWLKSEFNADSFQEAEALASSANSCKKGKH